MVCPKCGYVLDAFDVRCPRCRGRGVRRLPPPRPAPSPPLAALAAQWALRLLVRALVPSRSAGRSQGRAALVCLALGLAVGAAMYEAIPLGDIASLAARDLRSAPGFQGLTTQERRNLTLYVGGSNRQVSWYAACSLEDLLRGGGADAGNPWTFRHFLRDQPGAPEAVPAVWYPLDTPRPVARWNLTRSAVAPQYAFHSGTQDALLYALDFRGPPAQSLYVRAPAGTVPGPTRTPTQIAEALATLPLWARWQVRYVNLEPGPDPDDGYFQGKTHESTTKAAMSAGGDGGVEVYPDPTPADREVMAAEFGHEIGHIVSQRQWGPDSDDPRWDPWRSAIRHDIIVVSKYARTSPQEDFAETFLLYLEIAGTPQEQELRPLLAHRFQLLDAIVAPAKGE